MAEVATVADLLDSLDCGKSTAEQDTLDVLRERFGVPAGGDLREALQDQTPGVVLAAILDELRPFALMIRDIYTFLADAAVRTGGNLEVRIPLNEAQALHLDLKRFRQFEQSTVNSILASELDPSLLAEEGQWRHFHDGYWPLRCYEQSSLGIPVDPCPYCPPETRAADFERLTGYLEELDRIATDQMGLPPSERMLAPGGGMWKQIRRLWSDCQDRVRGGDRCPLESDWNRSFFEAALEEFDAARRTYTAEDLRRFLALPYWKQRWQFYEVWFVMLVLQSYGLPNLRLHTHGQEWTLAVGSVMPEPIAEAQLRTGRTVEFYYQYEGIPPSALFPGAKDRPEMLVQLKGPAGERTRCLLVAEAKARMGFSRSDMEDAVYPLLKWEPVAIVGANYFAVGSEQGLQLLTLNRTQIVAAARCVPGTNSATDLTEWLGAFWRRELGESVTVVLIDTSGSMPAEVLPQAVEHLEKLLARAPTLELLVATFADSTTFHAPTALDEGSIALIPSGGTALAQAVGDCGARLQQQLPDAGLLAIHVLTDLDVPPEELHELLRWASSTHTVLRIHTWPSPQVSMLIDSHSGLVECIAYLPT